MWVGVGVCVCVHVCGLGEECVWVGVGVCMCMHVCALGEECVWVGVGVCMCTCYIRLVWFRNKTFVLNSINQVNIPPPPNSKGCWSVL